jgi:hypothetical protein
MSTEQSDPEKAPMVPEKLEGINQRKRKLNRTNHDDDGQNSKRSKDASSKTEDPIMGENHTADIRRELEETNDQLSMSNAELKRVAEKLAEEMEVIRQLKRQLRTRDVEMRLLRAGNLMLRLLWKAQEPNTSHAEHTRIMARYYRVHGLQAMLQANYNNNEAEQALMNEILQDDFLYQLIENAVLVGQPGSVGHLMQLPQQHPATVQLRLRVLQKLVGIAMCIGQPEMRQRAQTAYTQIVLMQNAGYQPAAAEIIRIAPLLHSGLDPRPVGMQ